MTTVPTDPRADDAVERKVDRYRRLLVLYPRGFRAEFGDDLVQTYRDLLLFSAPRKGLGWRTFRDLVGSAVRERGRALQPGGRPSVPRLLAVAAVLLVLVVVGVPGGILLVPAVALVGLPILAVTCFARAWTAHRTAAGGTARAVVSGIVALVPTVATLAYLGRDAAYLVFLGVSATLIVSAAAGLVWGAFRLVRPAPDRPRSRALAVAAVVPSIAVLGFIIGASVNSYLNSLGPPGDHSVEHASADTQALWQAAHDGDLRAVRRLTADSCADPWVKFPIDGGRHNAKGMAEERGLSADGPYGEIADVLGSYQDAWYDRCGDVG